jgi:hypothetical protein
VFVDKLEIGLGVNDIGATITWDRTNLDHYDYDPARTRTCARRSSATRRSGASSP